MNVFTVAAVVLLVLAALGLFGVLFTLTVAHGLGIVAVALCLWLVAGWPFAR